MSISKDLLKEFGLNEKESEIYLSLLKSGPATVMNISNRLDVNRTTVHLLIESLVKKGVLVELREKNRRKLSALPPEKFEDFIRKDKAKLASLESNLPKLIESVYKETSFIKDATNTYVKYYSSIESINWLYDQILQSKELRTYVNAKEIIKIFPNNAEKFLNAVHKGMKLWDLHHSDSFIEDSVIRVKDMYPNFHIKKLPKTINFDSMDYLIFEGKVAIIFGLPNPHAIVIENLSYYEISKSIFGFIWKMLPSS